MSRKPDREPTDSTSGLVAGRLTISEAQTMNAVVDGANAEARFNMTLLAVFATGIGRAAHGDSPIDHW